MFASFLANNLRSLQEIDQSPYEPTMPDVSVSDAAILPVSLSLKFNMAMSTYNVAKGLGMTPGSMGSNPFTKRAFQKRLQGRYRSMAMRGLVGDVIHNLGRIRTPVEWAGDFVTGWARGSAGEPLRAATVLSRPWDPNWTMSQIRERSRFQGLFNYKQQPAKWTERLVHTRQGEAAYVGAAKLGFLEKALVSKRGFADVLSKFDPTLIRDAGGVDVLHEEFVRNIISAEDRVSRSAHLSKRARTTHTTLGDIVMGRHGSRKDMLWGEQGALRWKKGRRFALTSRSARRNATIHAQVREGFSRTIRDAGKRYGMQHTIPSTLPTGIAERISEGFGPMSADDFPELIHKRQRLVKSPLATAGSEVDELANSVITRVRRARALKIAGATVMAVGIGAEIASRAYRALPELAARTSQTLMKGVRMDFGGGQVLQSAALATERQRAMSAINNAQLNARYLMGNEAAYMH